MTQTSSTPPASDSARPLPASSASTSEEALPVDSLLDARGLACPLPLLKAKQALNRLDSGQRVRVLATDAGSVRDFRVYADLSGHRLLYFADRQGVYEYVLQKA